MMNFNLKEADLTVLSEPSALDINVLIDDRGNIGIVQNDLFRFLDAAGEIKSSGKRKKFVYIAKEKAALFSKNDYRDNLSQASFHRLFDGSVKRVVMRLVDYDTVVKSVGKHYHGPRAGLLLRILLDNQHQVHARAKLKSKFNKKYEVSKHKTKDEVIDNLKQSNAKWEKAMNAKTAEYNRMKTENESLHNKLAAAKVETGELQVRNTKLNNEVAELKSTLYDRAVNDTKKSWWQNVKGVFSR